MNSQPFVIEQVYEVPVELLPEEHKTTLKLLHIGLESFKDAGADFAPEKFAEGWSFILGKSLKEYLESEPAQA